MAERRQRPPERVPRGGGEGRRPVEKEGSRRSKSGCFGICQGVLTTVDVVTTLPSGQVLALTRIMPDFAVRGRSERSSARLRRRKQTLRDGKESKTHLRYHFCIPLYHTTQK